MSSHVVCQLLCGLMRIWRQGIRIENHDQCRSFIGMETRTEISETVASLRSFCASSRSTMYRQPLEDTVVSPTAMVANR
jgi:hypothetical protein